MSQNNSKRSQNSKCHWNQSIYSAANPKKLSQNFHFPTRHLGNPRSIATWFNKLPKNSYLTLKQIWILDTLRLQYSLDFARICWMINFTVMQTIIFGHRIQVTLSVEVFIWQRPIAIFPERSAFFFRWNFVKKKKKKLSHKSPSAEKLNLMNSHWRCFVQKQSVWSRVRCSLLISI